MNKQDFPIFKNYPGLIYLDNSATTHKPGSVIQAITHFYEHCNSNIHRGLHTLSQKATLAYEEARETVAEFIGAESEEIIFTKGTTESLNLLASLLVGPGDEIILSEMEHHSNLVPWQVVAKQRQARIRFIPVTDDFRLDLSAARKLISSKTKIISVTHLSNVLGTVNPISALAELAKTAGAILIVDAAQSAAHLPINVKELACDFLVFSGHKLCGPTGIGVLYGRQEWLRKLEPFQYGGGMIKEVNFEQSSWADLPEKFEAGTPPIASAIGLAAAIKYLQTLGLDKIAAYHQQLTNYALSKLLEIPGLKIIGPTSSKNRGPIFSFILDNWHSHDLGEALDKANIAVRVGHHCAKPLMNRFNLDSTARASFYFYNDFKDIDRLVKVLADLAVPADKQELSFQSLTEEQEIYKENLLEHYKNPHHRGSLPFPTFKHEEVNQICGDKIELSLLVKDNHIMEIKWQGTGCVISQAAISLLSDKLVNLSLDEAKLVNEQKVLTLLGIPISPTRNKCALLSLKALRGALK